uniref:Polycomb group ring finger 3 n=1 Tax=Sus scrofa TaxID=9823 RepID=A0A8D1B9H3_PIG
MGTAHAPSTAPPTLRSAPLGHFRLFVLNSGRVFFSCSWGGPRGSGAPSPSRRGPRVRPARPQPRRQVKEQIRFAEQPKPLVRWGCSVGAARVGNATVPCVSAASECSRVPAACAAEMRKQREFYHKLGLEVPGDVKGETCSAKQHLDSHRNGETKAEDSSNKEAAEEKQEEDGDYHRSDEQVSICLECNSSKLRGLKRKWIRCSAQATVLHLKKFIAKKLNLSSFNELDILCNEEILGKDHTLKFVVVTRWRFKKAPLLLHYRPKMDLL